MPYKIFYHSDIASKDLPDIPANIKVRIKKAVEERLLREPDKYGEPLKRGLRGYRKLRVGDYRVVYRVDKENIIVLKIGHRKEVYARVHLRFDAHA